ncbi:hypothetical protein AYO49_05825 [Verrucomicrobiaceae bacterium SCGC AG-212-N21]|nr:hypothetical protein AYO49_05825 [Verrucomicrobiaceae bacterium SCGC AG-212-N21]
MSNPKAKKTTKARSKKLLFASAKDLSIHPLLADLPVTDQVVMRLEKDAKAAKGGQLQDKKELHEEVALSWNGFVADIIERGIKEPLVCVKGDKGELLIVDGRHRFAGGKEAEVAKFPYVLTDEDPSTYILGAVCQRYHWSKSQRAYFALHLHPTLIEGAKRGPKSDGEISESVGKFASREDLARSIGVSADTIDLAARVHAMFRADKKARGKYEPLIFGGMSLKGVLAGDGAEKSSHGGGEVRSEPWFRIEDRSKREAKALVDDWDKAKAMGNEALAKVKAAVSAHFASLPDEIKEHAREALGA